MNNDSYLTNLKNNLTRARVTPSGCGTYEYMQPEEIQALVKRYLDGTASPEEKELLDKWYQEGQSDPIKWFAESEHEEELLRLEMLREIQTRTGIKKPGTLKRFWPQIATAAAILLMMSVGAYYLVHKKQPIQIAQNQQHDIAPGRNQATLTLAGGQKIILTKGLSGKLAQQGNTLVQVNNANAITYTTSDTETSGPVQYNTMATRRGEQSPYPLVLADGTRVWLNAASSITFPTAFKGTDREVTIKGEVYFEVAHNAAMPFRVRSDGQTVEVLGTHFDINSYDDEQVIKTTLLEGKVKVTAAGDRSAILAPGEQSILSVNTPAQRIKVVRADIDIEMAWRDGMFRFDSTPLSSIMTQVARWYDVDVVYKDEGLKNKTFFAMSTRFANASQLLHNLEQTGEVKFKIDGKKITVQHP